MSTTTAIFVGFCVFVLAGVVCIWVFMKSALSTIRTIAGEHAKHYAVAYVKGGSLMFIAATTTFAAAYQALPQAMKEAMPWVPFIVFFCLPVSAALSVLVAFLDRSGQRAGEEQKAEKEAKAATAPPFLPAART